MIVAVSELPPYLPARGALIGVDVGTKRIGVATSDPDRLLASAVETIARRTFAVDAARLLAILTERKAVGFILGFPINMDGSEGPRAQSTRAFARNFSNLTGLAIALWDERLSTAAVERELIGMDVSRARRAEVIDEHAAIFILQGALDRLSKLRGDAEWQRFLTEAGPSLFVWRNLTSIVDVSLRGAKKAEQAATSFSRMCEKAGRH